ncbi:MAG: electron transfer flavoprotein alpha subunit, partial [Actinomycetota bacterium]|nr:electron transfer flavoprotein alpha subunit [Actinomycetota bacterium]
MAEVLVLVEHTDGDVKKVTLELLTLARRLGEPSAVLIGSDSAPGVYDRAKAALAEHGAAKVYVTQDPEVSSYLTAPTAEVLAQLVEQTSPAAVLLASSTDGKEIAARLAVKTGSGVITDATDVAGEGGSPVAEQQVFGGSTIVRSKVGHGTPIITVRPNSTPPEAAPADATREDVTVTLSEAARGSRITDRV